MRTFTTDQETSFFGPVQTHCVLVRIELTNGTVVRLTTHDQDLSFAGETFLAGNGVMAQPITKTADTSPDTTSIAGIADETLIKQEDLRVGLYDGADVVMYQVDWQDPAIYTVIFRGTVVQTDQEEAAWELRLASRKNVLQRSIGELYSPTCGDQLCGNRCGVDPDGNDNLGNAIKAEFEVGSVTSAGVFTIPIFRASESGTVTVVTWTGSVNFKPPETSPEELKGSIESATVDLVGEGFQIGQLITASGTTSNDGRWRVVNSRDAGKRIFIVGVTEGKEEPVTETGVSTTLTIDASYTPSAYWAHARIEWTGGRNTGLTSDVYSHESDGGTGSVIGLAVPPPFPIAPGDTGIIFAGCDGRRQTCKIKFDNLRRFRGYPDLPGWDAINAYPDRRPTEVEVS